MRSREGEKQTIAVVRITGQYYSKELYRRKRK
jgi:hypothetical protein